MKMIRMLSVLLLLFLTTPAISQPAADTLIVPGVRIGKATLTIGPHRLAIYDHLGLVVTLGVASSR